MTVRPARLGEHVALTHLALRSVRKRWNYSDEFMAWEPDEITVSSEHIEHATTNVLESDGRVLGFYVLRGVPPELELSRMMVEPSAFGSGCGRRLWEHAVETAIRQGAAAIRLDADPNAEPFYRRMGAQTVGEHEWEPPMMPGWHVKMMRYVLAPR